MKIAIKFIYLLLFAVLVTSCAEEESADNEKEKFIRIFDNNDFGKSFTAIDIAQTEDGGFIILANRALNGISQQGIYLLKADPSGNYVSQIEVDGTYVNAIAGLTRIDGQFYFICMSLNGYTAQLAVVDANLEGISFSPVGLSYPAASTYVDNNFLILSYNQVEKESVVSIVNPNGAVTASARYTIGIGNDNVDEKIIDHFSRTGRIFPFKVGKVTTGTYFFNGFYDYAFSLSFINTPPPPTPPTQPTPPKGRVLGEFDEVGFSAIVPISGNRFAAAQFNREDNYLMPKIEIPLTGLSSQNNASAYKLPEFAKNTPVKIIRAVLNEKNVLIYAADTKSKQIGLLFYDESNGALLGSRYLGFSNPFEVGNVLPTVDGGLIVCGTTYIAGRFPRVCIIKLSKAEVSNYVK